MAGPGTRLSRGARYGVFSGAGVWSPAGARMMRQLVRGAVTMLATTATAWRPKLPRAHVLVKLDLIGRPAARVPSGAQPPERIAGLESWRPR